MQTIDTHSSTHAHVLLLGQRSRVAVGLVEGGLQLLCHRNAVLTLGPERIHDVVNRDLCRSGMTRFRSV